MYNKYLNYGKTIVGICDVLRCLSCLLRSQENIEEFNLNPSNVNILIKVFNETDDVNVKVDIVRIFRLLFEKS